MITKSLRTFSFVALLYIFTSTNFIYAQYYEYNFGTGKKSYTTSGNTTSWMPQPSAGEERIAIGNQQSGNFALMNPGKSALGSNTELRFRAASASNKTNYFLIYSFSGSGNTDFYFKFEVIFGDINGEDNVTSGTFNFNIGNGSGFTNHNDAQPQASQVFAGLRWVYGSSGAITTSYRTGNTSYTTISGSPFQQETAYLVEILANNNTTNKTVKYNGANVTI